MKKETIKKNADIENKKYTNNNNIRKRLKISYYYTELQTKLYRENLRKIKAMLKEKRNNNTQKFLRSLSDSDPHQKIYGEHLVVSKTLSYLTLL